jgi:drug/metabolite transporter (DMT)-like permease
MSLAAAAYLTLCLVWGSTFLALRVAVETMPPWLMIGGRSLTAGCVLLGFALARGCRLPGGVGLARAAVSGALLFGTGQALLCWAEITVPSGPAAVLNATLALMMPFAAWLTGIGRAPSLPVLFGLCLGFAGVGLLMLPGSGGVNALGSVAIMMSCLSWAFGSAIGRAWAPSPSVAVTAGLQLVFGGVVCLVIAAGLGEWRGLARHAVSRDSAVALVYLILAGSLLGFSAYAWLVTIWPAERLGTYTYVNPIVALLLGNVMAGEVLTAREFFATALILAAVAVVMVGGRLRPPGRARPIPVESEA